MALAGLRCLPSRPAVLFSPFLPGRQLTTVTPLRSLTRPNATASPPTPSPLTSATSPPQRDVHVEEPQVAPLGSPKWNGVIKGALAMAVCACIACLGPTVAHACVTAVEPAGFSVAAALKGFIDFVLHLDVHLGSIIAKHGAWTYAFLFTIVFCETGLVLTPFLPGDSLLFVAGALAGIGKLNLLIVSATFIVAAVIGDAVNYAIGAWLGERAVQNKIISKGYIEKTEKFFESYGGKTIVLARFVPIVRTFAPFVAGMSHMEYQRFAAFNVGGALLWTVLFCGVGFFFGNLPFVEKNFSLVVSAIVAISVLPIVYEILAARNHQQTPSTPQT